MLSIERYQPVYHLPVSRKRRLCKTNKLRSYREIDLSFSSRPIFNLYIYARHASKSKWKRRIPLEISRAKSSKVGNNVQKEKKKEKKNDGEYVLRVIDNRGNGQ